MVDKKILLNTCMREDKIPEAWRKGPIVPIWKRKGYVHDSETYKSIMLLSYVEVAGNNPGWQDNNCNGRGIGKERHVLIK